VWVEYRPLVDTRWPMVNGWRQWCWRGATMAVVCWSLSGCMEADVAPGSMLELSDPGSDLVGREVVSATEERIRVRGDGREIPAIVLLPDDYNRRAHFPLVLAVHNFGGGPQRIAGMIEADRIRRAGNIVIVPEAAGAVLLDWQGRGITLGFPHYGEHGQPVDDVVGLMNLLAVACRLYRVDDNNLNLAGFSQGATRVLELARRLDQQRPSWVSRVFAVAGSVVAIDHDGLGFPGADIVHYEPGHNTLQWFANLRTGEPSEDEFMPALLAAKACTLRERTTVDGVDTQIYACGDGRSVTRIYEPRGEHAWPGQPEQYDIWLLGRGSISQVKMTDLLIATIAASDTGKVAGR